MTDREKFEEWINTYFEGHWEKEKSMNGDYKAQQPHDMYMTWQACAEGYKQKIANVINVISELIDIYEDVQTDEIDSFTLQPARLLIAELKEIVNDR